MLAVSDKIGFDIDSQQILHGIGYASDCEPPVRMVSLVEDYLEHANDLVDAVYSYVIRDINLVQEPCVFIEGSVTFESRVIAQLLERCEKVALFTLTIGNHLEEMVDHLAESGLVIQATVLDAIGSVTAEKVAGFVQDRIKDISSAHGLTISRRFSPGYCDWDISQQKIIFRSMKGNSAGIRLTKGCLMLPRKSISGIIGIGPKDVEDYNPCKTCNERDCIGRR
ncbi:vitamin B12 dependent-methionine synthase activation domain-containing protein [Chloroflexota bacterium]